jgi:AraC-like DNA-binding protein
VVRAVGFLRRLYGTQDLRVVGDPAAFRLVHEAYGAGPISSATLTQTPEVEHRSDPVGRLTVARVLRGRVERHTAGESLSAERGDVFLMALPGRRCTVRAVDAELQLVQIDLSVVAELTATRSGPALFTRSGPVSPAAARHCAAVLEFLARDVLANADVAASPLVVEQTARLLGATLLTTFPNTVTERPAGTTSVPTSLRRALAFIEEHAAEPVSLAQIAAAIHVTPRTLQATFRQRLGTTPTQYLRRVRLERAHRELLAADPVAGVGVTDIAHRWGFFHAGRFAAQYRKVYGNSPRQTLRSAGG